MRLYEGKVLFEASIDVAGYNYLVIYGKHINGYFCAIPNWKIACEMSTPDDTLYNFEHLHMAGIKSPAVAKTLAKQIRDIASRIQNQ